jgi:hypothetical protein
MGLYRVHHLKDGVDQSFFLKQRPRFDKSIAESYCINKPQLLKVQDERNSKEVNPDKHMQKIAVSCKSHWEGNNYLHVADVKARDVVQALRNTNNINGHWFLTIAAGVEVISNETGRNTGVGDIIEVVSTGELLMVYGYTFINIHNGRLID